MTATVTPIGSHAWWNAPHPETELAESIEKFILEHGHDAWVEVRWLYRSVDTDETHAFVDHAVDHVLRRDTWLHDPQHAADLYTDSGRGDPEQEAGREDQQLHDLVNGWVRTHEASRP